MLTSKTGMSIPDTVGILSTREARMIIYDGLYEWEGWGGKMKLGSGRCRLRIHDLRKRQVPGVALLKPHVVIVSDLPVGVQGPNQMTVKSCASHIATKVVREFHIDPARMVWVEYYGLTPEDRQYLYARERFDEVEFIWKDENAIGTKWRALSPSMEDLIRELIAEIPADPSASGHSPSGS